jgi:hypothetical protein
MIADLDGHDSDPFSTFRMMIDGLAAERGQPALK